MAVFRRAAPRRRENYNDPLVDDSMWLRSGQARYSDLVTKHYGSPDTIAAGGDLRLQLDDPASAIFFYQKAIDTLHSIYVCGPNNSGPQSWSRTPSGRDDTIVDCYLSTLRTIRSIRPSAPITESVTEVTHRLRTISSQFKAYGLDPSHYLGRLDALAGIAPDVDVSGVFWS